jgi:hypothetical protein
MWEEGPVKNPIPIDVHRDKAEGREFATEEGLARDSEAFLKAVSLTRALNHLSASIDFSLVRDPRTGAAVTVLRQRATGKLVNLCSLDDLLDALDSVPAAAFAEPTKAKRKVD